MSHSIPFDNRDGQIWLDGQFIPWKEATTHVINHGLHYGGAVFEGERAYNGTIFKMAEHHMRLLKSAEIVGYQIPFSQGVLDQAAVELLTRNNLVDAYVRPIAWRGSAEMGLGSQNTDIHVAIAAWAWPSYFPAELRLKGIKLVTSPWKRPAPDTAPVHAKAASLYNICTMSKNGAMDQGYTDALMLDYRGYVAEATSTNLFFVKEGALHTPTPDCFLNGLTRQTIIEFAREDGIKVIERHITPEELPTFDECFTTGTAGEITCVAQIDDIVFEQRTLSKHLVDRYTAATRGGEEKVLRRA